MELLFHKVQEICGTKTSVKHTYTCQEQKTIHEWVDRALEDINDAQKHETVRSPCQAKINETANTNQLSDAFLFLAGFYSVQDHNIQLTN